jgi:hypothetical protein
MSSYYHFLENVQFSDGATFHVSGAVNRRNVRIWGSENPCAYVEHQRDSPKFNVYIDRQHVGLFLVNLLLFPSAAEIM